MLVIAHRGACDETTENSMDAFARAISGGADRIELDIQSSADHEIFVFHDRSTRRLTKQNLKLGRCSAKELKQLRLPNDEPIPTLREVLEAFDGQVEFNIELKDHHVRIVDLLLELLERVHVRSRIIVSSFQHDLIAYLADRNEKIERALLFDHKHFLRGFSQLARRIERCRSRIIHPEASLITPKLMKNAQDRGWLVYPYISLRRERQVPQLWQNLQALKIDGLCTNHPRMLHAWLQSQAAK